MRTRLIVRKSNKYIYAQLLDSSGKTLAGVRGKNPKEVGTNIAKKASSKEVVFDRGVNRYHGQIKQVAEAARTGGLKF